MEANRCGFDPKAASPHDRRFNAIKQNAEVVSSAGFGALLVPGLKPSKGKIFVTTIRLAAILDDPRMPPSWSAKWCDMSNIRVKKGFMGATAFVTSNDFDLGVDSTKAIVGDIERAWLHLRGVKPTLEHCHAQFPPQIDVLCSACGGQIPPGSPTCRFCLRVVDWPTPLAELSRAQEHPDSLLPERFPDGSPTQRDVLLPGLSTLVIAAHCAGETDFVKRAGNLVTAIQQRRNADPDEFGSLPRLRGAGDEEANAAFWRMATKVPSRFTTP